MQIYKACAPYEGLHIHTRTFPSRVIKNRPSDMEEARYSVALRRNLKATVLVQWRRCRFRSAYASA